MSDDNDIKNKKINAIKLLMILQFLSNIISVICGTYLIVQNHLVIGIVLYIITYFNRYNYRI